MFGKRWAVVAVVAFCGCGVDEAALSGGDDAELLDTGNSALSACAGTYERVCAVDGRSHTNACYAGGEARVLHRGYCTASERAACASTQCPAKTHCEIRGLNGGIAGVCIQDPTTPTCATTTCGAGYHCEMKGLNGGAAPVCIRD